MNYREYMRECIKSPIDGTSAVAFGKWAILNQENVETSKLYDEMEGYQQLFSELKKQGIDVPTIREINASNKNKLRNMKNKRTKSK